MPHIDFEKINSQTNAPSSAKLANQFYVFTNESRSSMLTDSADKFAGQENELVIKLFL